MAELLGEMQNPLAAPGPREADVPLGFRMLVAGGFKRVEDCVCFRELFDHDHATALPRYGDATGYEASMNAQHVEDHLPRGAAREPVALAVAARSCAVFLLRSLRAFSDEPFRVIVSVSGRQSTIRFHRIRDNESWLAPDLDGYGEAVLVLGC
ncbi:MAG: hypothetical protein H0W42_10970 [Gemmatimonadaceae bacterium]|nr:hypothetical protein [Gemmatimonadaceae bacterium]